MVVLLNRVIIEEHTFKIPVHYVCGTEEVDKVNKDLVIILALNNIRRVEVY